MKPKTNLLLVTTILAITLLVAFTPKESISTAELPRPLGGKFLFLSDIHVDTTITTSIYGTTDTGKELWYAFQQKVQAVLATQQIDFIVYTGDLPGHTPWQNVPLPLYPDLYSQHNNNISTVLNWFQKISKTYKKPVYYLPGNNDALDGDYYSFSNDSQKTVLSLVPPTNYAKYFFPKTDSLVKHPFPNMISANNLNLGFYSAYLTPGLRLVALNTVIYSANYKPTDGTTQLNNGNLQLAWLAKQLKAAKSKNEKVYLAMHIPPGLNAYSTYNDGTPVSMWTTSNGDTNWNNNFLSLCAQYKNTISGILYGHTHMDELRLLYDSSNKVTEVAISAPGITPLHQNNPGFKVVQYNTQTKELTNFTTYYTTLPINGSQLWGNNSYSFSEYFKGKGNTIFSKVTSSSQTTIDSVSNLIYQVQNGAVNYAQMGVKVTMQKQP